MKTQFYKTAVTFVMMVIFAAPALAQDRYEFWRRDGRVREMREVQRPALIENLAETSDPAEAAARTAQKPRTVREWC